MVVETAFSTLFVTQNCEPQIILGKIDCATLSEFYRKRKSSCAIRNCSGHTLLQVQLFIMTDGAAHCFITKIEERDVGNHLELPQTFC